MRNYLIPVFLVLLLMSFFSDTAFSLDNGKNIGKAIHPHYNSNFSLTGISGSSFTFCRYAYYYDATTSMIGRSSFGGNCPGGDLASWVPPSFPSAGVEGGNGNFYILCAGPPVVLCQLDTSTGAVNIIGQITGMGVNVSANGMAYDPVNDSYYLCGYTESSNNLYNLDINTLAATLVSGIGSSNGIMIAIAIDSNGVGYGYETINDNNAYTFDPVTGSSSLLGPIGFNANYGQDMDIDRATGVIYLAAFNMDNLSGELRTMDPNTGMTTLLYQLGDQFSVFEFDNGFSITPVELTSFAAEINGRDVKLSWATATETNNKGFEVERKSEDSQYRGIAFIEGYGTTAIQQQYIFVDKNISVSDYFYRLKQIDFNGAWAYSKEVEVDVNTPLNFFLSQNYPNPFNPVTTINYSIPKRSIVTLKIYDILGEEVATLVNEEKLPGLYEIKFDGGNLSSGVYIYRLTADDFFSSKKFTLLK